MTKRFNRRKILFGVIYLIIIYILTEFFSWTFYLVKEKSFFSFADHQQSRLVISQRATSHQVPPGGFIPIPSINAEVIHPYLGFVIDPDEETGYSEYGFQGNVPTFGNDDDNTLIIGIFGGSFAAGFAKYGADRILSQLRQLSDFFYKKIIVQTIALGGYKQPQQLLALTYFLTLGAHFDIAINLDGFNEVALAPAENADLIYPFYPRGWAARVSNFVDPEKLRFIGRMVILDEQITRWAHLFAVTPLRYNITANVIWRYRHIQLYNRRMEQSRQLEAHAMKRAQEFDYVITGPSFHYDSENAMFQALAKVWKTSSLQMHQLCEANNIAYFHFLQPNQYVPGSKIMNEKELEVAFQEDHLYRRGVIRGYPLLIQEGKNLQKQGVNFHDLTMIFANNDNLLYSDNCCHVNVEGYQIIGTAIGKTIIHALNSDKEMMNIIEKPSENERMSEQ